MQKQIIVSDWDCTLAEPHERAFYGLHHTQTKLAIADTFNITAECTDQICATLQQEGMRIEKLLTEESVADRFALDTSKVGNFTHLKDRLNTIDPKGWFSRNPELVESIRDLKKHFDIIILSNSPTDLIKNIGHEIGFDMENDFTGFVTMTAENGPPKFVSSQNAFQTIMNRYNPNCESSWAIGDSVKIDLDPAKALGFSTGFVDNIKKTAGESHSYSHRDTIVPMLRHIQRQLP